MNMDNDGAKREISAFQLAISDAGTIIKLGFSLWVIMFQVEQQGEDLDVLPSPMSSARHGPNPNLVMNRSQ